MRLDRWLVEQGQGSRREVGIAVRRGRVTVDGVTASDPAAHVRDSAEICVNGARIMPAPRLLAWHKPLGVLSTFDDPWGRDGLDEVLPAAWRANLHPVGRLDRDTSGLLLFCADGALTQRLLHPRFGVQRVYRATIAVDPPADLTAQLAAGVSTAEGVFCAEVRAITGRVVEIAVAEGKYRMVRRILHNAGASVEALHRIAYGPIALGDLAPGDWRVEDTAMGPLASSLGIHRT